MKKITFSARLHNPQQRFKTVSGRIGDFILRSYDSGKRILAYYRPRHEPLSSQPRAVIEALSRQLREMAWELDLFIERVTYNFCKDDQTY